MQLSTPLSLLRDLAFWHRVQARLADSAQQVSDGWPRQLRLGMWMPPSSPELGWEHWGVLSPASKKILCFSRSQSCLIHLACHLLPCCPLPEWVEGLPRG